MAERAQVVSSSAEQAPALSIVIPVFNEQDVLPTLFARLYPVLDSLGRSYDVTFVDDGSRDDSPRLLADQHRLRPDVTRVVLLRVNAGQHAALVAGFQHTRGRHVITLDADLQNPPEEIPKLVAALDAGHDYVGSIRRERHDSRWRSYGSVAMNKLRERITDIRLTDQGCMLRAYDRDVVDAILDARESQTFIPAAAYLYAGAPTEVTVEHEARAAGRSKYSLFKLIHLNFDLVTSFSTIPLQLFSLIGMGIALVSFLFVIYLVLRRLLLGPEVQGVFTLFAIAFFLIGIVLFGIGLLGEYVGRIHVHLHERPGALVRAVLEPAAADGTTAADSDG